MPLYMDAGKDEEVVIEEVAESPAGAGNEHLHSVIQSDQEFQTEWPPHKKHICSWCASGGDDLYVKLILLESQGTHMTKALPGAGTAFQITPEMKGCGKFPVEGLGDDLNLRVIIYDDDLGEDRLIGYNDKLNLSFLQKEEPYLEVPTANDGKFTGNVHMKMWFSEEKDVLNFEILGCTDILNEPPEQEGCDLQMMMIGMFIIFYVFFYAGIMYWVESGSDCSDDDKKTFSNFDNVLWFVLVTFTSVGYGDIYPCTDEARVVNAIFILLNQLTLAWLFSISVQILLTNSTYIKMTVNLIMKQYCPTHGSQHYDVGDFVWALDAGGDPRIARIIEVMKHFDELENDYDVHYKIVLESDEEKIGQWKFQNELRAYDPLTFERIWHELVRKLIIQGAFVLFVALLGMFIFQWTESSEDVGVDLTLAQTFHFSMVTMSTVGYGDWAPVSSIGRGFGSFYILFGVALLANFAGIMVEYVIKHQELSNANDFLENSLASPKQLMLFDTNGDKSVSKYEYVTKSLVACKFVTQDKIDLIMQKFYDLDKDKSGEIDVDDFKKQQSKSAETPGMESATDPPKDPQAVYHE